MLDGPVYDRLAQVTVPVLVAVAVSNLDTTLWIISRLGIGRFPFRGFVALLRTPWLTLNPRHLAIPGGRESVPITVRSVSSVDHEAANFISLMASKFSVAPPTRLVV